MVERILITPGAEKVVLELTEKYGALMFHQSGGCCDGSAPMCFEKGEFRVGSNDVCLGTVAGTEFWMSADQFEYWKHTELTLDVTQRRGASFSLEIPLGIRFVIRSRVFEPDELQDLRPVVTGVS